MSDNPTDMMMQQIVIALSQNSSKAVWAIEGRRVSQVNGSAWFTWRPIVVGGKPLLEFNAPTAQQLKLRSDVALNPNWPTCPHPHRFAYEGRTMRSITAEVRRSFLNGLMSYFKAVYAIANANDRPNREDVLREVAHRGGMVVNGGVEGDGWSVTLHPQGRTRLVIETDDKEVVALLDALLAHRR
jgi:hypothetical protein